jgi:tryptophanyl-tRNA synthetase
LAKRKRVLSGMRPTGRLHIGHYFGALQNWRALQDKIDPKTGQPEYDCYFPVVDWHALTTHYEDTASIAENTLQVTMDWLSVGLDPVKSTLFIQSRVLEHAELHLILSMITPLGWLERVPTYKEIIENLKDRDLGTYGFLGYPLLQSADIVLYGEPGRELLVPVGEDQVPHIELAREIVRRFNTHYGFQIDDEKLWKAAENDAATLNEELGLSLENSSDVPQSAWDHPATFRHILDPVVNQALRRRVLEEGFQNFAKRVPKRYSTSMTVKAVLREPDVMLTETPRLPGTDGRRMAKSYGNFISLSEPLDSLRNKARNMLTDPARVRRTDPGNPDVCPVFAYHNLFSTPEIIAQVNRECRTAEIGCVDCKKLMADALVKWIEPIQAKRREFESHPQRVWDILDDGSKRAKKVAGRTMKRVRNAIFGWDAALKASADSATPSAQKVASGD